MLYLLYYCAGRPWPVAFGAGVGLGMGYANCQHDFMQPYLFHGKVKKVRLHVQFDFLPIICKK